MFALLRPAVARLSLYLLLSWKQENSSLHDILVAGKLLSKPSESKMLQRRRRYA
jgi:hypothetical protein